MDGDFVQESDGDVETIFDVVERASSVLEVLFGGEDDVVGAIARCALEEGVDHFTATSNVLLIVRHVNASVDAVPATLLGLGGHGGDATVAGLQRGEERRKKRNG